MRSRRNPRRRAPSTQLRVISPIPTPRVRSGRVHPWGNGVRPPRSPLRLPAPVAKHASAPPRSPPRFRHVGRRSPAPALPRHGPTLRRRGCPWESADSRQPDLCPLVRPPGARSQPSHLPTSRPRPHQARGQPSKARTHPTCQLCDCSRLAARAFARVDQWISSPRSLWANTSCSPPSLYSTSVCSHMQTMALAESRSSQSRDNRPCVTSHLGRRLTQDSRQPKPCEALRSPP